MRSFLTFTGVIPSASATYSIVGASSGRSSRSSYGSPKRETASSISNSICSSLQYPGFFFGRPPLARSEPVWPILGKMNLLHIVMGFALYQKHRLSALLIHFWGWYISSEYDSDHRRCRLPMRALFVFACLYSLCSSIFRRWASALVSQLAQTADISIDRRGLFYFTAIS